MTEANSNFEIIIISVDARLIVTIT